MGLSTKTGSFTKNASTGAQAVTGVGFLPKAIIFWTSYQTSSDTPTTSYRYGWGCSTGAAESFSISAASQGGVGTTATARRCDTKPISIVNYDATLLSAADLTSFDADGFTLDWTTNGGGTQIIHYLALGGTDLTGQKVVTWSNVASTGNQSVTGVGFQPNLLFTMKSLATATTEMSASQALSLGVVSAASNYASLSIGGNSGVNTAAADYDSFRAIKTDAALIAINTALSDTHRASLTSMDSDGFTLNWSVASTVQLWGGLALKGPRVKVGTFTSASAITGVGFTPSAVAFLSTQRANTTNTFNLQHDFGATTGVGADQSANIIDSRIPTGGGNTDGAGTDSTGKCYTRVSTGPTAIQTQAALSSFDSDGFTLSWSAGTITDIIGYIALGGAPSAVSSAATNVTTTGAQLNGTVNPSGSPATYYFEWGLTTAYGNTTAPQGPSSSGSDFAISDTIAGLTGNTVYHFRAIITGGGTTILGNDLSFTTPGVDRALMVF